MRPHLFAALLCLLAIDGYADVTIKGVHYALGDHGEAAGPREPYTVYVKDERMRMDSGDRTTVLVRPTSGGETYEIVLLDHARRQAMIVSAAEIDTAARTLSASGEARNVRVVGRRGEAILGYDVTEVEYSFEGHASLPGLAGGQEIPAEMADLMKVRLNVSGTALVSRDVEGVDEITDLYRRIGTAAGFAGGQNALANGLSDVMALVAQHGFPLRTTTTSEARIEIEATGPIANMLRSMTSSMANMKSTTVSQVTEISPGAVEAALFFDDGLPEGYAETELPGLPAFGR